MATIQLRAFLEAEHEVVHDVLAHRPRANFDLRVLRESRTTTELKEAIREEMRAIPRSVCNRLVHFLLFLEESLKPYIFPLFGSFQVQR